MQIEKFTNFSISAGSVTERYRRQLKAQPPKIRQFGVPAEDDRRSVEVSTDDLAPRDQSVQFSYGDDTDLLEIMGAMKQRNMAKRSSEVVRRERAHPAGAYAGAKRRVIGGE